MADSVKLILASRSPRRRQLLAAAGVAFDAVESGIPEGHTGTEKPRKYAVRMAREKALAVSRHYPDALVVGADTIVVCGGQVLEKPESPAEARGMLMLLSGLTHEVVTAFAIARGGMILESEPVESRVSFRVLSNQEIDAYIATGEPFDKAGAYGIQGQAAGFIVRVEGPRDNVMGLPTEKVVAALGRYRVGKSETS
ncbi:MAG TPA: nucleoside triphosphate pyrophosphatase [Candidatus Binataceae bacterium]|nr:nucleoside triphosphate pyrophosphatase [Candidatus Binataceae bacterium]